MKKIYKCRKINVERILLDKFVYLWQLKLGFEAILCTLQCNSANNLGRRKNINKMKKMYKDCAMTFKVFTQLIK